MALVAALPAGASALELVDSDDFDQICEVSACVERAFPALSDGAFLVDDAAESGSNDVTPVPAGEEPSPSGTSHSLHAVAPADIPTQIELSEQVGDEVDPFIASHRARDYARDRARTVVDSYSVIVGSAAFAHWSYDEGASAISAMPGAHVELFGGTHALVADPPEVLLFPMGNADAETVLAEAEMGGLEVRLWFTLSAREDPWEDMCVHAAEGTSEVRVRFTHAELVERWAQAPRARAETVSYAEELVRSEAAATGQGIAVPLVELTHLEFEGDGCGGDDATVLSATLEAVLTDCYLAGLARNASLDGALVVDFALTEEGHASSPVVRIDVLQSPYVQDCVLAALDRVRVQRPNEAPALDVSATIRFGQTR